MYYQFFILYSTLKKILNVLNNIYEVLENEFVNNVEPSINLHMLFTLFIKKQYRTLLIENIFLTFIYLRIVPCCSIYLFRIRHILRAQNTLADKLIRGARSSPSVLLYVDSVPPVWLARPVGVSI